jgi:signal transduction histidine kinase
VKLRGATQDITEQRAIDEKVRQAENLRIAGQLSGGFAHEFNNLLQILMGNIDLARDHKKYDARMVRLLDSAREAIRRGKDLTESLLAFSRQQELVPTPVDPGELIHTAMDMLAPSLSESIRLEKEIAERLPRITIDVSGLETAILNIALNAVKAMPWGGTLSIRASLTRLDAVLRAGAEVLAPGSYLEIAVADTGCGMPEEVLARACEPFFTTREVGQGTGLGLSMVQGFVRQSNGALTLDSRMGEGTTARLLLPVTEAHNGSGGEIPKIVRLVEEVPS